MPEDVEFENTLNLVYLPDGRVVNETNQDPAIPRVTGHQHYWVAADLGQANDFTAVTVIKDEALPIVDDDKVIVGPRYRSIVYADRFRGVSYVDVVNHLVRLRNAPPFGGKSELVIELAAKVGDGARQAAFLFWVSITSIPSLNVMPWMTFGN